MKQTNNPLALLAAVALALSLAHLSCTKEAPPSPSAPPPPPAKLSVRVNSIPEKVEVMFEGKTIGHTPVKLKVNSFDQLVGGFATADAAASPTVEQRITAVSDSEYEVNLVLDPKFSKMTKALGLSKIIVFDYGASITFDLNKADLKPSFRPMLAKQAETLKNYFSGVDVYVCGHTDDTGTREWNETLSLQRAQAIRDQLLAMGVPKSSLKSPRGFANSYPVAEGRTESARAKNRRVEIILGR